MANCTHLTVNTGGSFCLTHPVCSNDCSSLPEWLEPRSDRNDIFSPVPTCHSLLGEEVTKGQTATTICFKVPQ